MGKTAWLFPGQGAQKCGMGQSFYDADESCRLVYGQASSWLGMDIAKLCFEKNDNLDLTEFTQPAMVTTGIAMMQPLLKRGLKPDVCAGLSLGEYEAVWLSQALSAEEIIKGVALRGKLMASAVPAGEGAMAAVLAMESDKIEEILSGIDGAWIANYNCPGQIVITGKKDAVEEASVKLKEAGAKRVLMLNVSGPFHSPLLKDAGAKLGEFFAEHTAKDIQIPYVANYSAEYVTDKTKVTELLVKQVSGSVRWEQSIRAMINDGVDTFIEIGPGKTLTGFVRKIAPDVKTINIENYSDMEAL